MAPWRRTDGASWQGRTLPAGARIVTASRGEFNARVTHRSLFDGSNQGIALTDAPAFSFQGHPEASPGPHDVANLFDRFIAMMAGTLKEVS